MISGKQLIPRGKKKTRPPVGRVGAGGHGCPVATIPASVVKDGKDGIVFFGGNIPP